MEKRLLVILVGKRSQSSVDVQSLLTEYGCMIKTRLGIHDGVLDQCSEGGLIILELVGTLLEGEKLLERLNALKEVSAKLVELKL